MKNAWKVLTITFFLMVFQGNVLLAKNILKDLIKIYTTYQEINMMLWLSGDVKAEKRFGEELKWITNLTNKRVKDPETNRWVGSIFERLKPQFNSHGLGMDITVLEGNTVNAFAIPGGHVYVYKGMLDFVNSDDELAAVLGHEMAHVERRHSLKQFRKSTALQLLLQKAVKNKRDRDSWGQLLGALTMLSFSREDEDESDDLGQRKMAAAGFDPAAQILVWQKFSTKFGKGGGIQQYLSSHPPSEKRVDNARRNLAGLMNERDKNLAAAALKAQAAAPALIPPSIPPAASAPIPAPAPVLAPGPEKKDFPLSFNILADVEENLIQNGSFETDLAKKSFPDAWTQKEGRAGFSAAMAYTGKQSLRLAPESGMRPVKVISEFIPVSLKERYVLRGWVKSGGETARVSVGAELYDKSKRLRGFVWPVLSGFLAPTEWTRFEGTFAAGKDAGKSLPPDTAFIKVALQSGPLTKGEVCFDDLVMQRGSYVPPKNLLQNGSFELAGQGGLPKGVAGSPSLISRDLAKGKMGYASLKMIGEPGRETVMEFAPIPMDGISEPSVLQGSFHFMGSAKISGKVFVSLQDEAGNTLPRHLLEREFTAKPDLWEAGNLRTEFRLTDEEKKIARSLSVKIVSSLPANGALWLDGFVLR